MTYTHDLVFYQTITPLHVGCGQDVGVVDLPVIRERTTGYPFIPGSGLRGTLREVVERKEGLKGKRAKGDPPPVSEVLFGPELEDGQGELTAGCVAVHDAKLLFFPVRSDHSVFVWITCPFVLERFAREAGVFAPSRNWGGSVQAGETPGDEQFLAPFAAASLYLEEHAFERYIKVSAQERFEPWLDSLATTVGRPDLAKRAVLVNDRTFAYFARHATQVQQHVRLSAEKTVIDGALFSVEAVPPESVFYGFLGGTDPRHPDWPGSEKDDAASDFRALKALRDGLERGQEPPQIYLTLGGDEGTGFGVTHVVWQSGDRP